MSDIISKYIESGAMKLYHDYRAGTCHDFSGNGNDGTPNDCYFTGGGIRFKSGGYVYVAPDVSLEFTTGTVIALFTPDMYTGTSYLATKRSAAGVDWQFYVLDTPRIRFQGDSAENVTIASPGDFAAVKFSTAGMPEFFSNGLSQGTDGTTNVAATGKPLYIGNLYTGTGTALGELKAFILISGDVPDTDIAGLYGALKNRTWSKDPSSLTKAKIKIYPGEEKLAAGWDMTRVNDSVIDKGSSGSDGELIDVFCEHTEFGDLAVFDGVTSGIDCTGFTKSAGSHTFSFCLSTEETAAYKVLFYAGGTFIIWVNTSTAGQIGFFQGVAYKNFGACPNDGTLHQIVMCFDSTLGTAYMFLDGDAYGSAQTYSGEAISGDVWWGRYPAGSFPTEMRLMAPKILDGVPDDPADYAKREYRRLLAVGWLSGYGVKETLSNVTSGLLSNSGWTVNSGEFNVSNDSAVGKCIECVSAGNLQWVPGDFTDGNIDCWYYDGSWASDTIAVASNIIAMSTGDKLALSSNRGSYKMWKELLS